MAKILDDLAHNMLFKDPTRQIECRFTELLKKIRYTVHLIYVGYVATMLIYTPRLYGLPQIHK